MMEWDEWDRPARYRAWSSFDELGPEQSIGAPAPATEEKDPVDEFGLDLSLYGRFPLAIRRYVNLTIERLGISKDQPPQNVGFGTVPELVFYGMLLEAGFTPTQRGFLDQTARSFIFQSQLLGGRQPGGAVADFVVFRGDRTIAVRVQSVFHAERNPFGSGGAKAEEDRNQRIRLESAGFIHAVVDVNRERDGYPLEHGPLVLMKEDRRRVLSA